MMLLGVAALLAGCDAFSPEARFDREIAADPQAAAVMAALAQDFPAEHRALRAELIGHVEAGADQAAIRTTTAARMNALIAANRQHIAAAPDRQLLRMLETQRAAAEALKTVDVGDCATFVMGGTAQTPDTGDRVQQALADSTVAVLRGAAAGKRTPARRDTGPVSQRDIDAFADAMRAEGADAATVDAAIGSGFGAMPAAQQCDGGIMMMRALEAMPRAAGIRIFALVIGNG
jgi:hypothetical protein